MSDTKTPLESNGYYHIYNHAVGKELLFPIKENYRFFLSQMNKYLSPYFDFFSYCLMPNHFHLIVRVKSINETFSNEAINTDNTHLLLSRKLSNLFNSYAQAINKQQNRKGSLFYNRFKRKEIKDENYLTKLIHYLHYNPVQSGLSDKPITWEYSSYQALVSNKPTLIQRKKVIELFGGVDNFIFCHKVAPSISGIE